MVQNTELPFHNRGEKLRTSICQEKNATILTNLYSCEHNVNRCEKKSFTLSSWYQLMAPTVMHLLPLGQGASTH